MMAARPSLITCIVSETVEHRRMSEPQSSVILMMGTSDRPRSVSEYSTLKGTSAKIFLATNPIRSISPSCRFLVLAALITPTSDVFTLLFVALPMCVLYEASIWLAGRTTGR